MLIALLVWSWTRAFAFRSWPPARGLTGAAASVRHISIGQIDLRVATGLTLGGIPAVFVAAFIVKSMSVEMLRRLVIFVVLYAAAVMIRAALGGRKEEKLTPESVVAAS